MYLVLGMCEKEVIFSGIAKSVRELQNILAECICEVFEEKTKEDMRKKLESGGVKALAAYLWHLLPNSKCGFVMVLDLGRVGTREILYNKIDYEEVAKRLARKLYRGIENEGGIGKYCIGCKWLELNEVIENVYYEDRCTHPDGGFTLEIDKETYLPLRKDDCCPLDGRWEDDW